MEGDDVGITINPYTFLKLPPSGDGTSTGGQDGIKFRLCAATASLSAAGIKAGLATATAVKSPIVMQPANSDGDCCERIVRPVPLAAEQCIGGCDSPPLHASKAQQAADHEAASPSVLWVPDVLAEGGDWM